MALDSDPLQTLFEAQLPEPSSLLLARLGLIGLAVHRRGDRLSETCW